MRSNLKYAVTRRIHDGLAGAHVLRAQLFDDFRSRGGLVADRFASDEALEFCDHVRWESVFVDGESLVQPDARHFPMPGSCIFPGGTSGALAVRADGRCYRLQML